MTKENTDNCGWTQICSFQFRNFSHIRDIFIDWNFYVIVKPQKIGVSWKLMPRACEASEGINCNETTILGV